MNPVYLGNNAAFDSTFGIQGGNYYSDDAGNVYDDSSGSMVMVGSLSQVQNQGLSSGEQAAVSAAASGDPASLSWVDSLVKNAPAIALAIPAFQLAEINIQRAKNGQAPINQAAYGPQVSIGLSQQTMLMIAGIAIAGFLLLRR